MKTDEVGGGGGGGVGVAVGGANTNTETKRPSDFTAPGQLVPTLPQHDNQDG